MQHNHIKRQRQESYNSFMGRYGTLAWFITFFVCYNAFSIFIIYSLESNNFQVIEGLPSEQSLSYVASLASTIVPFIYHNANVMTHHNLDQYISPVSDFIMMSWSLFLIFGLVLFVRFSKAFEQHGASPISFSKGLSLAALLVGLLFIVINGVDLLYISDVSQVHLLIAVYSMVILSASYIFTSLTVGLFNKVTLPDSKKDLI